MSLLVALMFFQDSSGGSAPGGAMAGTIGIVFTVVAVAIGILEIAALWKIFVRAGQPGWAAIVPIYNYIVLCKIGGKPGWWFLILWLIVPWFMVCIGVARNFGKGTGFGIGLALLLPLFLPILAWSDSRFSLQPAAA
jgi:hypothetical protein